LSSVERRAAAGRSPALPRSLRALSRADAAAAAVGLGVTLAARAEGAYSVRAWGLLGLGLVAALAFLGAYGVRVSRAVVGGAVALVALGLWAVLSVAWGGLPETAWSMLDRSLLAASALVLGGAVAGGARRALVQAAVLGGIVAQSVEILVRGATGSTPGAWFHGRMLEGPVGYHNAQGLLCAIALPLALRAACGAHPLVRAGGAAAAAPLLAVLLLTQSRGALAAAGVAVACQLALARRLRLLVAAALLVGGGAVLAVELRSVDRALLIDGPAGAAGALRSYALVGFGVAVVLAAAGALPAPRRRLGLRPRTFAAGAAGTVLVVGAVAALLTPSFVQRAHAFAAGLATDTPPASAPGDTRFATISLDGRREAWRVAVGAIREAPLTGDGAGRYAARWGVERRLPELYILQPHSLELELGAELGAPGVALFAAFLGAVLLAVRSGLRADRGAAAAAAAAVVALLVEASADWTWSFPGIVAPVLFVVGAAAVPSGPARKPRPRPLLLVAAAVALVALAVPYVAAGRLARASSAGTPAAALAHVRAAEALDPWNPDALSTEGRLREARGEFAVAAALYAEAARRSQRPWLDWFRQARALRRGGAVHAAVNACLLAQHADPSEDLLHRGPCGWPWLALHVPGVHPARPEGATRRSSQSPST
jgi:hypothetical protein